MELVAKSALVRHLAWDVRYAIPSADYRVHFILSLNGVNIALVITQLVGNVTSPQTSGSHCKT